MYRQANICACVFSGGAGGFSNSWSGGAGTPGQGNSGGANCYGSTNYGGGGGGQSKCCPQKNSLKLIFSGGAGAAG